MDLARQCRSAIMREHAPLGRARDGDHRLAAHVPRVPDRLLQAAARVQLGRRRHPAGAHAAAVASPATCCRGTSWRSGPSPSARTWPAPRRSWATKGRAPSSSRLGDVQLVHAGSDARFALLGGRFVGEGTLLRFYVLHCVGIPLVAGVPDGRPLLARPQGRRHLGPALESGRGSCRGRRPQGRRQLPDRARDPHHAGDRRLLPRRCATGPLEADRWRCAPSAIAAAVLPRRLHASTPTSPSSSRSPTTSRSSACSSWWASSAWLAMYQALENDEPHRARASRRPEASDGEAEKILSGPTWSTSSCICLILVMVVLIVWSIVFKAPHRGAGQPGRTPNPSKAPWYFLGLQEMLVYFDPWLAGVVLPAPDHRRPDGHPLHRHEPEGQRLLHLQGARRSRSRSSSSASWSSGCCS